MYGKLLLLYGLIFLPQPKMNLKSFTAKLWFCLFFCRLQFSDKAQIFIDFR